MAWTTPKTWLGEKLTSALLNTHLRDQLEALAPTDIAWTDYTPTLTNMTEGNGTVTAKYHQIGRLVTVEFSFVLGSTSTMGTNPTISLPVTGAIASTEMHSKIGTILESGVRACPAVVRLLSNTTAQFRRLTVSGSDVVVSNITATAPHTWGTNDELNAIFEYPAA